MGLLDKIEGFIEKHLSPNEPSQSDGSEEEKRFHTNLLHELKGKYNIDKIDGIIIANKIYSVPVLLSKGKQTNFHYYNNPLLPTSHLELLPYAYDKREYTKKIVYSIMDEDLYMGVMCCRVDEDVFVEIVKNYEGISTLLLNREGKHAWMQFGLKLAEKNKESGESYFNLCSTISRQKLEEFSSAIKLSNLSQAINLYLKGRTGQNIPLKLKEKLPADFQHLEQTIFTDGKYVYMPQEVNQLNSKFFNERFAWRATTHEAGHITESTFKVDVKKVDEYITLLKKKYENNEEIRTRLEKKAAAKKRLEEKKRQAELKKQENKKKKEEEQKKFEEYFTSRISAEKLKELIEKNKK